MGKKKRIVLIFSIILIVALGAIGVSCIYLLLFSKTTANIAIDFKKLDYINNKYLVIRTLSQKRVSGTWLSWNKPGNGYALSLASMEITKVNSVKGVAGREIEILGTYNDNIYVYQVNKGITRIRNGKSYNIVSYPTPVFRFYDNYLLYSIGKYDSDKNTTLKTINLMNLEDETVTKIYEYSTNEYNNGHGSAQDFQIINNNLIAIQILASDTSKPVQLYDFSGTIIDLAASDSRSIKTSYDRKFILTTNWTNDGYFASSYDPKSRKRIRLTNYQYYEQLYNVSESVMVGNTSLLELLSRYGTPVEKDKDLYSVIFQSSDKIFFQSADYYRIYSVNKKTGEKNELFNSDKYEETIQNAFILSK